MLQTGIGGLTLGGGVGCLIRKYGMTFDNLHSFQLLTAQNRVLTAGTSESLLQDGLPRRIPACT
jgi:FAD/FMN-containing dehydrogenase